MTAKAWSRSPSSYLPELSTAEAFMLDEACAYVLSVEQKRIEDEILANQGNEGQAGKPVEPNKPVRDLRDLL